MPRKLPWLARDVVQGDRPAQAKQGARAVSSEAVNVTRPTSLAATHVDRATDHAGNDKCKAKRDVPTEGMRQGADQDDRYIMIVEELDEVCDLVSADRYASIVKQLALDGDQPGRSTLPAKVLAKTSKCGPAAAIAAAAARDEEFLDLRPVPVSSRVVKPGSAIAVSTKRSARSAAPIASVPSNDAPIAATGQRITAAPSRATPAIAPTAHPEPPTLAKQQTSDAFNMDFMFDDVAPAPRPAKVRRVAAPRTPSPPVRAQRPVLSTSPEPAAAPRKKTISLRDKMQW